MSSERLKLFYNKEIKLLEGRRQQNHYILLVMLFVTFIGLGHSIGGLDNLEERMDNPFTSWVNLPINPGKEDQIENIKDFFKEKENRNLFLLDTLRGNKFDYVKVVHIKTSNTFSLLSRTIDPKEKLFKEILKSANIVSKRDDFEDLVNSTGCWMIVRKEALQNLGYEGSDISTAHLEILYHFLRDESGENLQFNLQIPIIAIVNDLPDYCDILITDHFSNVFFKSYDESSFIRLRRNNNFELLSSTILAQEYIQNKIDFLNLKVEAIYHEESMINGNNWFHHNIYLDTILEAKEKIKILQKLAVPGKIKPFTPYECGEELTPFLDYENNLAFSFISLERIREFRDSIKTNFGVEISLNQIEDKENFALVVSLTSIISLILFLLSLLSVLVFVVKVLVAHLEKVQPNLGTFKAFGLSDYILINDYRTIIFRFMLHAFLKSAVMLVFYWIIMVNIGVSFSLYHWSILLSLILLFGLVFILTSWLLAKKLKRTPGELIYSR